MSGAAYETNESFTDDETISFTYGWTLTDGTGFPWGEYAFEYRLKNCGAPLTADNGGIIIDPEANTITFSFGDARMRPGTYRHGCRVTHIESGEVIQIFDGNLTITEGNFR